MKVLSEALTRRKIDAFIKEYESMSERGDSKEHEAFKEDYLGWKKKVSEIDSILQQAKGAKKWLAHTSKNERVLTAAFRSKGKFQMKAELKLASGLQNLCKLLANSESYPHIFPFCESCKQLKVYSPLERDMFARFKIPFLNDRCIATRVIVLDRLEENSSIVIYGEVIKGKQIEELVKQVSGQTMKLKAFITQIKVNKGDYTLFTYGVLDDTLSLLPNIILKKILQISNAFILSKVMQAKKNDTSLDKFTSAKNDLNTCIENRIQHFPRL